MPTKIFLVQHGDAVDKEPDRERPLSATGREQTQRVAAAAARLNLGLREIRHSGKTRAQQTAALFGVALSPRDGITAIDGLRPNDDLAPLAQQLQAETQAVMLVGHLPHLSRLAGRLVAGSAEEPVIKFQNSAIVCLEREVGDWTVAWLLTPDMAAHIA